MYKIIIFLLFLLLIPDLSLAEADPSKFVTCHGTDCDTCDLVEMFNAIIKWLIGFMFLIFAILIFVAGFKMVISAGNSSALEEAKSSMSNAFIGIVIVFASWIIVNTLMNSLLKTGSELSTSWSSIKCIEQAIPKKPVARSSGQLTPGTPASGGLTHEQALEQLGGISVVSSGDCTDRNNKRCTSLDGMQPDALAKIVGVVNSCEGCDLKITAGTEIGHTNACHQGGTCVDIKCSSGCTDEQVKQVKAAADNNSTRVVYETLSCADRDRARTNGLEAYCKSDPYYGHITGDHFSLYTVKK